MFKYTVTLYIALNAIRILLRQEANSFECIKCFPYEKTKNDKKLECIQDSDAGKIITQINWVNTMVIQFKRNNKQEEILHKADVVKGN